MLSPFLSLASVASSTMFTQVMINRLSSCRLRQLRQTTADYAHRTACDENAMATWGCEQQRTFRWQPISVNIDAFSSSVFVFSCANILPQFTAVRHKPTYKTPKSLTCLKRSRANRFFSALPSKPCRHRIMRLWNTSNFATNPAMQQGSGATSSLMLILIIPRPRSNKSDVHSPTLSFGAITTWPMRMACMSE